MPELPELEVVREVLERRVVGQVVRSLQCLLPGAAIVMRDLTGWGWEQALSGAEIVGIDRRGKFLLFSVRTGTHQAGLIVVNPKLTGRLQLALPEQRLMAKTHLVLEFENGEQLRYIDQKSMGQVYLTSDPDRVADFRGMGPEPLAISLDEFRARLKPFRGEIKGILTRSVVIAGIGNAYADEILWAARLYPFRKRTSLSADELVGLYGAMRETLENAIRQVRAEMGEQIHLKPRDFLSVHMRSGEPCPRCGSAISVISANQRITNFCRTCQPGGMVRGLGVFG